MEEKKRPGIDLGLSEKEKNLLHKIARSAIESRIKGIPVPEIHTDSEILKENRGAFVSLHRHGSLRGCIGYIHPVKPLYETIQEMAVAAAFQDPRFNPLSERELKDLDIEISVLTPMKKISDFNEIEVGKHGLYIKRGFASGLLLPQVATQYGWGKDKFLEQTCLKAGLPADAWKDKETEIYIFSADIF